MAHPDRGPSSSVKLARQLQLRNEDIPLSATLNTTNATNVVAQPAAARRATAEDSECLNPRVLIVDDNAISQLVTLQQLQQFGCPAEAVSSGAAALEFMRRRQVDLVFLDCRMPDLDGYMTARAIRSFEGADGRARAAIVAITGDGDIECVDKCLSAGMDGHLSKPASTADLQAILDRFLP